MEGQASTPRARMTSASLLVLALLPKLAQAVGDYACVDTSHCATDWKDTPLSSNATCVPDPLNTEYGYCGYVGAPCVKDADCDYGRCGEENRCTGYLGAPCDGDNACLAYFFCGTDGLCGGSGANCMTGDAGCLSSSCSEPFGSSVMGTCATVPSDGVQLASACSQSSNCESGFCDEETFLCSERRALPGASQAARMRTKRDGTSGGYTNPKNKRGKMSAWFKSHTFCTAGQTACSTVGGYDCINTQTTLESCGGCPQSYDEEITGQTAGVDCTSLPFVDEVYCQEGKCRIVSCIAGTRLSDDGVSCVMRK